MDGVDGSGMCDVVCMCVYVYVCKRGNEEEVEERMWFHPICRHSNHVFYYLDALGNERRSLQALGWPIPLQKYATCITFCWSSLWWIWIWKERFIWYWWYNMWAHISCCVSCQYLNYIIQSIMCMSTVIYTQLLPTARHSSCWYDCCRAAGGCGTGKDGFGDW